MIIAKVEEQHTKQQQEKGKLEPTIFLSCDQYTFIVQYTYTIYIYHPNMLWPFNQTRLDSSGYI